MDVMESGKPPLKDRGNMVTSAVSPKVTEGTNNSDDCTEEIPGKTAELHNGGTQLGAATDSVVGSKTKKDTNENAKKTSEQDTEHAISSGEKWKMQFDLSDASSSSDSDGSEVETTDKVGEQHKEGPSTLKNDEKDDVMDFQGFDTDTTSKGYGMVLNKIIDLTESSLTDLAEASTSYDDIEITKETYFHSSVPTFDENGMEEDEKEDVKFALKIISESIHVKEELMDVDSDNEDLNASVYRPKSRSKANRFNSGDSTNSESRKKKKKVKEKRESSISEETNMAETTEDRAQSEEMTLVVDRTKVDETSTDENVNKDEQMFVEPDRTKDDASQKDEKSSEKTEIETDRTKANETSVTMDSRSNETTVDSRSNETTVDSRSNEISVDSKSNEVTTPAKVVIPGHPNEEMSSELTSSTNSSPSLSSKGSFKMSAASGSSGGRYSRGVSPALSGSGGRGKKSNVDMSNPAFLKPFELGWRRELVFRNTNDNAFKKMADIYYYTPAGKKVRSNREVSEYVDGIELTMENFTFFKEPIGLNDPAKEIIRDAKKVVAKDPNATPVRKTPKPKMSTPVVSPLSEPGSSPASPQPRSVPPKTFPKIKVSSVRVQKLTNYKTPVSKQKKSNSEDGDMEIGMLPPMWSPKTSPFLKKTPSNSQNASEATWSAKEGEEASNKGKRKLSTKEQDGPPAKRTKNSSTPTPVASTESEKQHMQFFMMNICAGYSSLLHVFQYLKVQELLRAARVCRMWRDIASHHSLWRTVRMKNSQVGDWEGLVKSLKRHETQHLDLRKMLVPSEDTDAMWDEFCRCIGKATSLQRIDLCRCPARVVEKVAESCPQLKIINALAIKCSNINLQGFGNHKNLQELRLKSQSSGFRLTNSLSPLKQLSSLKHLSLTTLKELGKMEPSVLGSLKNLESLELGECCDFSEEFGPETLSRLKKLERLRLEKGQGKDCPTFTILEGIATLPKLTHLELVNFDVKPGFDKALAQCKNIRRLLIIPTYVTQSATTNHMVLNGVNHLKNSLTHFVWGVTHELLRVTELFVDQCEGQKDSKTPASKSGKKSWGSDSIPILKPIHQPSASADDGENCVDSNKNEDKVTDDSEEKEENDDAKASAAAPQVEILPLPKLQKLLTSSLPKTKVKILKIPFHATWRQTISESTL